MASLNDLNAPGQLCFAGKETTQLQMLLLEEL
jgi:hypothetical protein